MFQSHWVCCWNIIVTDFGELCVLTPSMLKTQHVVRIGVRPCFCLSGRSAAGTLCWHTATGMLRLVSELWFKTESSPSYVVIVRIQKHVWFLFVAELCDCTSWREEIPSPFQTCWPWFTNTLKMICIPPLRPVLSPARAGLTTYSCETCWYSVQLVDVSLHIFNKEWWCHTYGRAELARRVLVNIQDLSFHF